MPLTASTTPGGNVTDFVMRGDQVLYRADQEANGVFELFSSRLPLFVTF
jgi:hypothetical protein